MGEANLFHIFEEARSTIDRDDKTELLTLLEGHFPAAIKELVQTQPDTDEFLRGQAEHLTKSDESERERVRQILLRS